MDITNMLNSFDRIVGKKQVLRKMSPETFRCVIVAEDADIFIKNEVVALAELCGVEVIFFPTMEKLGELCGIDVKATVVGLMK